MKALGSLLLLGVLAGCVYFNTFYNAEKYYAQGEKLASEGGERAAIGDRATPLPAAARTAFERSIEKSSTVLASHPGSDYEDDALLLLGKAHLWLGNDSEAAAALRALMERHPQSGLKRDAMLWLVRASRGAGDAEAASRVAEELLASEDLEGDDRIELELELAALAVALDDAPRAIAIYEGLQKSHPELARRRGVELLVSQAKLAAGDEAGALEKLREFLGSGAAARRQPGAVLPLVDVLASRGDSEEARQIYRELLQGNLPDSVTARIHFAIGEDDQEAGDVESAVEEFGAVARRMPGTPLASAALYRRGVLEWRELKQRATAKRSLLEAYLEDPDAPHADSAAAAARVIQEIEHYQAIVAGSEQAASPVPPEEVRATATYLLAELLYTQERNEPEARALFQSLLDRYPRSAWSPKALYTLGWLAANPSQPIAASDSGSGATATETPLEEGATLTDEARGYFERLAREFPETEYASYALERLAARPGTSPPGSVAPLDEDALVSSVDGASGDSGRMVSVQEPDPASGTGAPQELLDAKLLALTRALPRPSDPLLGIQDRLVARRATRRAEDLTGTARTRQSRGDVERARELLEASRAQGDSAAPGTGADGGAAGTDTSRQGGPAEETGSPGPAGEDERIE